MQRPNPVKNEKKKVETEFCQTKTVDLLGFWISISFSDYCFQVPHLRPEAFFDGNRLRSVTGCIQEFYFC